MPLSQRLGWIGIDVGTHAVKLAQTVRDAGSVRLHRTAVIQRPASWSGEDALALEQPITSYPEIRDALECGGFTGRDALCALPMNACRLRGLHVPPGDDHERRAIIADELAEEWAELRQPMEFDFWEMDTGHGDKGSETFNVNVLMASRAWGSQLWRDCRQNGLDCWAIDGAPLAMARAVELAGGLAGGRRTLAIDWGYSNTTLCIVGDGRPVYTRRVHDCAFGLVLESIMTAFDVALDEAQHLALTQGLGSSAPAEDHVSEPQSADDDPQVQGALRLAAARPLEELVHQIGRTLQFMEVHRRHTQPAGVWLLGGGASLRGVEAYLAGALRLPVRVWHMPCESHHACATGSGAALFGQAAALSAAAWRAA